MRKILIDVFIVVGVIFAYIFLAAFQPGTNALISSANSTMPAGFDSTKAMMNAYPIYVWFLPGLIGIILFVVNHKYPDAV